MELPFSTPYGKKERQVPLYKQRIRITEKAMRDLVEHFVSQEEERLGVKLSRPQDYRELILFFQYVLKWRPDYAKAQLKFFKKWHLDFLPQVKEQSDLLHAKDRAYWALSIWDFEIQPDAP